MEIHNFYFTYFISLKMWTVPILVSFSTQTIEGSMSQKKSKAILNDQNPSARSADVNLFSGTTNSISLPSSPAPVRKHSSPSSCVLLTPLVWCLLVLELLQDPHLETLQLPPFFAIYTLSLSGSVVKPVKSCTTSGRFHQEGIYCFRFDDVPGFFYNNDGVFNGVILADFHDVLAIQGSLPEH